MHKYTEPWYKAQIPGDMQFYTKITNCINNVGRTAAIISWNGYFAGVHKLDNNIENPKLNAWKYDHMLKCLMTAF